MVGSYSPTFDVRHEENVESAVDAELGFLQRRMATKGLAHSLPKRSLEAFAAQGAQNGLGVRFAESSGREHGDVDFIHQNGFGHQFSLSKTQARPRTDES